MLATPLEKNGSSLPERSQEGAILVRLVFYRERVLRDRQDLLSHHDDFLYERYRFCRQGIIYLQDLLEPFIANTTVEHCLSCPFFPAVHLSSVGHAENKARIII